MEYTGITNACGTAEVADVKKNEDFPIACTLGQIFGFLASIFNNRPDAEFVGALRESPSILKDMAEGFDLPNERSLGIQDMLDFVEDSAGKPDVELERELAVDWTRLFRGINPQISPKPPYEGVYVISEKSGSEILQSVIHFYHESGFFIGKEYRDRLDYIGVEFDFLGHLADMEAQAWSLNDVNLAIHCQARGQEFINTHLGFWADKFLSIAIDRAQTGFYRGFLRFCLGILSKLMLTGPFEQGGVNNK